MNRGAFRKICGLSAVVFSAQRDLILKNYDCFADKISPLTTQLNNLEKSGKLEKELQALEILPGGEKVRGKEIAIFRDFIHLVERTIKAGEICSYGKKDSRDLER